MPLFDGSEVIIGKGAQADVVKYMGFAYKIYRSEYPSEWIAFEKQQQDEVNKLGLSKVRYYDTEDTHIVKMDLVEGETLEKKLSEGHTEYAGLLVEAFRKVHAADIGGVNIPRLEDTAGMGLTQDQKAVVFPIIERLSEKYPSCVCHLDMHFQNILIPDDGSEAVIIDWMNTRIAPAVFDYARTYVIFREFAPEIAEKYMEAVSSDIEDVSEEDIEDAITVCAVLREIEKKD